MLTQTIPILRFFDEAATRRFYLDFLGFTVDWEHRFEPAAPLYLQVSRDEIKLHLTQHHGDCTPGSTVFVVARDLKALHQEISGKDYPFNRPGLDPAPWGGLVMEVTDPASNRLRIWEDSA
ncbi:MAG: glyoxalase superfamily protein [Pseudomonadota bacterium]